MKTFIPIECDILFDDRMSALINKAGTAGYGVYMILLIELRNRKDYCMDIETLRLIARKYNIRRKLIDDVLYNYELFTVDRMPDNNLLITSEYVTRIMQNYHAVIARRSISGKKGANMRWRKSDAFAIATEHNRTEHNRTEEEKEEEKENVAAAVVAGVRTNEAVVAPANHWLSLVAEAFNDRSWLECQAKHSGLGKRFGRYEEEIAAMFIDHVVTHGKEHGLLSVSDVKYYFANYVRRGTTTNRRITEELDKLIEARNAENPFETIDPDSGRRTYFGKPIPPDAPPRPNNNVVWAEELQKWI